MSAEEEITVAPAKVSESVAEGKTPRIVGTDGLTNKERRKAKQAEKRKRLDLRNTNGGPEQANNFAGGPQKSQDGEEQEDAEIEAVSHKARRKRRKLEKKRFLPASSQGQIARYDEERSRREEHFNRSRYSIWVGNLSFSTTIQRLQRWLEEREISGITRIKMSRGVRKHEQNKG